MTANIVVIGSTSVYAVFRFVGVMICVVLSIRTMVRRFAASTQLRSDLDVISWVRLLCGDLVAWFLTAARHLSPCFSMNNSPGCKHPSPTCRRKCFSCQWPC